MPLDPVVAVKQARALLDDLAALDLASLPPATLEALVRESEALGKQLDAHLARAAAAFDASGAWAPSGAQSAAAWMRTHCQLDDRVARAQVRCGRDLRSMPEVERAFVRGDLTARHVHLLGMARQLNAQAFDAGGEAMLLDFAHRLSLTSFAKAVAYWRQLNDPDRVEVEAADRYERREAHCSQTYEGTVELQATFDPVSGEIVHGELRRLEQQLFDADWAEARARCGPSATKDDLRRTASQRRCDALRLMAERSAALAPDARAARPLITVLVDRPTLFGRVLELANGTVLTPGELVPLLRAADFERVVFDGPSRVLDVGVRQRLFTGATRRAVEVRDMTCSHESCDRPASDCDVDHLVPYEDGGLTVQSNGGLKCRFHHRWRHRHPPDDDDH